MTMHRVLVLGGTGMLGSMLVEYLGKEQDFFVRATARDSSMSYRHLVDSVEWKKFDAESPDSLVDFYGGMDAVINAIGVIKPYIKYDNSYKVQRAIYINAIFPHILAKAAQTAGVRVLQIATDCVFSGTKGNYVESDKHDALDVYGKTKSLGEVRVQNFINIRCSIIGPERKGKHSFLEWFLGQKRGAKVNGFTNHLWNGVTTLQFAKVCAGIVRECLDIPNMVHLVPANVVNKAFMVHNFAKIYGRSDITIQDVKAPIPCDRSLATEQPEVNDLLWRVAGYVNSPSVEDMINEMSRFTFL